MASYGYEDLEETKSRYLNKLNVCSLEVCQYQLADDAWVNDPTEWPNLEWSEIYNYLVNSLGIFTREVMKNHKSLDAHNQFNSSWARTVISK